MFTNKNKKKTQEKKTKGIEWRLNRNRGTFDKVQKRQMPCHLIIAVAAAEAAVVPKNWNIRNSLMPIRPSNFYLCIGTS